MTNTAPVSRSHEEKVLAHAVALMYQRLGATQIHLFLMPAVIIYAFWEHVSHALLLAWGLVVVAVGGSRVTLAYLYRRRQPGIVAARRWGHYFTVTSVVSGVGWGLAGMLFFVPGDAGLQVLLYTSIMGLAAGSVIVTAYWLPGFYTYAVPAIALSALRLAMEGTFEYQGLAVLMLMYLSILVGVGRSQKQAAYDAIHLRFENLELIEQLREQKHVAEQASIAKSKFLAAASHDLRQPLHALSLFVATLNERVRQREERDLAEHIQHSVTALEGLFNALLDISRLDAGIVQPRPTAAPLRPLLQRLATQYAPQAAHHGLAWRVECEEIAARTDPVLLETILHNLIGNAIRYTREGHIVLRAHADGAQAVIAVEDTGIGIAPEDQPRIFEEFVQLQNPERDRNKGLGLGLAIVRRLTDLLRHELRLESRPGSGTTFQVRLPLAPLAMTAPAVREAPFQGGGGFRVLVIDDEVIVREAIALLLGEWGYEVWLAESGEEALEIAQSAPDVIVADYRLRENRTGLDAIRAIHACWGSHIPALIITGDTAPEQLRDVIRSGYSLLHKPVQPGRLRSFLRQATTQTES